MHRFKNRNAAGSFTVPVEKMFSVLGVEDSNDVIERNHDYLANEYYMPVYEQEMEWLADEMDEEEAHEIAEEKALEALSEGEYEFYKNYMNTLEDTLNEIGGQAGLVFEFNDRTGEWTVDTDADDMELAEFMRETINGLGYVTLPPLEEYLEDEGYESPAAFVLDHWNYVVYIPEVWDGSSFKSEFERALY